MLTLCVMLLYRYSEPLPQLEVALRKAYLELLARGTGKGEPSVSVHCGVEVTELSTNKQHSLSLPCGSRLKAGSAFGVFFSLKGLLTS